MKNIIIGVIIAVLLIGGIAGASILYNNLSEEYNNDHNGGFEQMTSLVGVKDHENKTEEKVEATTKKNEITTEKLEHDTDDSEATTEKLDEPTKEVEQTTEKAEQTTEKIEIVFNAADFTVLDWEGNNVRLSDFAGKPIVLNFWATWCYYCKVEMPEFDRAAKELTDVQFLMVNATDTESMAAAKKYIEEQGFDFDVFFDTTGTAQRIYGVSAYPTTFFINADGSKIYYISGMIDYKTLLEGISLVK